MYCINKCIVQGKQARVKNADLHHPSCTVVMQKRKSASPVLIVLMFIGCDVWYFRPLCKCSVGRSINVRYKLEFALYLFVLVFEQLALQTK